MTDNDENSRNPPPDGHWQAQSPPPGTVPLDPAAARLSTKLVLLAAAVEGAAIVLVMLGPTMGPDVWRTFLFAALPIAGFILGWHVPSLPAQYRVVLGSLLSSASFTPLIIEQLVIRHRTGPDAIEPILAAIPAFAAAALVPFFLAWFLRSSR